MDGITFDIRYFWLKQCRLGIALGAKLYYSFTDEDNWDNKIKELNKGRIDYMNS